MKLGILIGDTEELMKNFIPSIFMCHGLGHFLGLDTHDVGGYPSDNVIRTQEPGLKSFLLITWACSMRQR